MPAPKILFLLPYPLHRAPSQRFRVEQFLPALDRAGIRYRLAPFMDDATWAILYKPGNAAAKATGVLKGYLRRVYTVLFVAPRYEFVMVHREATPLGPPVFEWWIAKVLRKKLVYDFDDAIWIPNTTAENKLAGWVKWFGKIRQVVGWAHRVAAGNAFLAAWAGQNNRDVRIVPTCVDVTGRHNRLVPQQSPVITIGWTGSHSTLKYLEPLLPVLRRLASEYNGTAGRPLVDFLVISNREPSFELERLRFLPWREATEIEDLASMHIGLMPLEHDAWSEGKCGFKLIQYLALGIPAVASPVGVNKEIMEEGVNGYLCTSDAEWYTALVRLVEDAALRAQLGKAGREKIVSAYSIQANEPAFLRLFT